MESEKIPVGQEAYGRRLSAIKQNPKSGVSAEAVERAASDNVEFVDVAEVDESDRRLAEMGYTQVWAN